MLAVDLAENDILCPNYGDNICKHMSLCHKIKALKVTEARGADMAACVTASCERDVPWGGDSTMTRKA